MIIILLIYLIINIIIRFENRYFTSYISEIHYSTKFQHLLYPVKCYVNEYGYYGLLGDKILFELYVNPKYRKQGHSSNMIKECLHDKRIKIFLTNKDTVNILLKQLDNSHKYKRFCNWIFLY